MHQQDTVTVNMYVSNNRFSNTWRKIKELNGETDNGKTMVGDFNTLFSIMDKEIENQWENWRLQ